MPDKQLKFMWMSNAMHVGSGYGVQSKLFITKALEEGWRVIHPTNFGFNGAKMQSDRLTILPSGFENHGADMLAPDMAHYKPDVAVLLYDSWVFPAGALQGWTAYAPVDASPIPSKVIEKLHAATWRWSMSRFGQREMRLHSIINDYVPHAVDCETFIPSQTARERGRSRYGWDDDTLVVMTVAANKGAEDRKNLKRLFKAWAKFVEDHPGKKLKLYVHSNPYPVHSGIDFQTVGKFYGIPDESLLYPDGYGLVRDHFSADVMNMLYNAADAFILPSGGEGFGVPIIEAQAAGLPVAVTDFTAMSELGEAGHLIPVDILDDLEYTAQGTEWARPKITNIVKALEWALSIKGDQALRKQAAEFAMNYEINHVWATYAKPAILKQVEFNRQRGANREARKVQFERMLRQKTSPPPFKTCPVCGSQFFGMRDTCSAECAYKAASVAELTGSISAEVKNGS